MTLTEIQQHITAIRSKVQETMDRAKNADERNMLEELDYKLMSCEDLWLYPELKNGRSKL